MRPGQAVNTPDGPGMMLHPVCPGHPEKAWWVLFGRSAKRFGVNDLGELGMDVNVDTIETTEVHTKRDTGPWLGDNAPDRCLGERRKPCSVVSKAV